VEPLAADRSVSGHLPGLDGLRAVAATGVLLTHVAFQTGMSSTGVSGAVLARLDLAVAVFFALSGFLLWRPWAVAAATGGRRPGLGDYALNRAARILPAYLVLVVGVLWLLPENQGSSGSTWLANLTLTQVFVPLTLAPGLTHLWSLSVEAAFYVALPLLGLALARTRGRRRIGLLVALGLACLGWSWLRAAAFPGVQADLWLPAHLPWFLVGVVLAELVVDPPRWLRAASARPWPWLLVAAVAFGAASTPLGGPSLLAAPSSLQAATKTLFGAVVALSLLAPLALGTGSCYQRALSTGAARVLGRWSYGIFLWHLAVLAVVFPLLGVSPFSGHAVAVGLATAVLTVPVAAASYALVEEPARLAARRVERLHRGSAASATTSSAASTSS
jgi:peptidoglycan/LPS O-acetylase OafA/YrhL